jgi:hypothetical protein
MASKVSLQETPSEEPTEKNGEKVEVIIHDN